MRLHLSWMISFFHSCLQFLLFISMCRRHVYVRWNVLQKRWWCCFRKKGSKQHRLSLDKKSDYEKEIRKQNEVLICTYIYAYVTKGRIHEYELHKSANNQKLKYSGNKSGYTCMYYTYVCKRIIVCKRSSAVMKLRVYLLLDYVSQI